MAVPPKRAAVDLEEMADKRLSEISAADFLQLLEQGEALGEQASPEEATVRDVLVGTRAALRLPVGGLPEKKKVEREKWPLEKFAPEKLYEQLPEKKKVELEKQQVEGFPEKKKVELEKQQVEGFPEKKKVELEKQQVEGFLGAKKVEIERQSVEPAPDVLAEVRSLGDRLAAIEEQLSRLAR